MASLPKSLDPIWHSAIVPVSSLHPGVIEALRYALSISRDVRACVFCPYCEEEDQRHRVVTCTLWPKDPADHRRRLTPGVWRADVSYDPKAAFEADPAAARR